MFLSYLVQMQHSPPCSSTRYRFEKNSNSQAESLITYVRKNNKMSKYHKIGYVGDGYLDRVTSEDAQILTHINIAFGHVEEGKV